jgi:hypothetical protein
MKCRICGEQVSSSVKDLFAHLESAHFTSYGAPHMPIEFVNATLILFYGKAINVRLLRKFQKEIDDITRDPGKIKVELTEKSAEGLSQ